MGVSFEEMAQAELPSKHIRRLAAMMMLYPGSLGGECMSVIAGSKFVVDNDDKIIVKLLKVRAKRYFFITAHLYL